MSVVVRSFTTLTSLKCVPLYPEQCLQCLQLLQLRKSAVDISVDILLHTPPQPSRQGLLRMLTLAQSSTPL